MEHYGEKLIKVSSRVTECESKQAELRASWQEPALQVCTRRRRVALHAMSEPDAKIWVTNLHPFVNALETAYSNHLTLRLKPDDVWLTIAQGVSDHINAPGNAEKFRSKLVVHEGRQKLVVVQPDGPHWDKFVETSVSMAEDSMLDKTLCEALRCDFSTTTPAASIASRIVTMKALETYFEYSLTFGCGIPCVIMEGTLEDWQRIVDKVEKIEGLDLGTEWWLDELKPVLHQFLNTYKGEPDEDFWSRVVSRTGYASGPQPSFSGWVCAFFPYTLNGKHKRSPVTGKLLVNEVPTGVQSVAFKLQATPGSTEEELYLEAGFLGCHISTEENSVAPHIGWMLTDPPSKKKPMEVTTPSVFNPVKPGGVFGSSVDGAKPGFVFGSSADSVKPGGLFSVDPANSGFVYGRLSEPVKPGGVFSWDQAKPGSVFGSLSDAAKPVGSSPDPVKPRKEFSFVFGSSPEPVKPEGAFSFDPAKSQGVFGSSSDPVKPEGLFSFDPVDRT